MSTIDIKITINRSDTSNATPTEAGSWQPIETAARTSKSRLVWCPEMLALLTESQTGIDADWKDRRDALLLKVAGDGKSG